MRKTREVKGKQRSGVRKAQVGDWFSTRKWPMVSDGESSKGGDVSAGFDNKEVGGVEEVSVEWWQQWPDCQGPRGKEG